MGVRTTGCHHMAFVTNNMDETVKFYNGILGFPIVVTLQLPNPTRSLARCRVISAGAVTTSSGSARATRSRSSSSRTPRCYADNSLLSAGNHLAITVPVRGRAAARQAGPRATRVKINSELDHGFCHSIYFEDPVNKIALEFATWQHPCDTAQPFLQDPNPVPPLSPPSARPPTTSTSSTTPPTATAGTIAGLTAPVSLGRGDHDERSQAADDTRSDPPGSRHPRHVRVAAVAGGSQRLVGRSR